MRQQVDFSSAIQLLNDVAGFLIDEVGQRRIDQRQAVQILGMFRDACSGSMWWDVRGGEVVLPVDLVAARLALLSLTMRYEPAEDPVEYMRNRIAEERDSVIVPE